jgi:hypothetical protein
MDTLGELAVFELGNLVAFHFIFFLSRRSGPAPGPARARRSAPVPG